MGDRTQLSRVLAGERLAKIEGVFRQHFQLGLETRDINGKEVREALEDVLHN